MTDALLAVAGANLVATVALLAWRWRDHVKTVRAQAEAQRRQTEEIAADVELVGKLEYENIQGPKLPAVTALVAGARDELEKGAPLSGRTRTFVLASQAQLTDINDAVSAIKLKTDLARKKGTRSDG